MRQAATEYEGYARVSTEEQARGDSPDIQAAKIREYASRHGLPLARVTVDLGKSGKSMKREGWDAIRARLEQRQIRGVIIAKLDRLTRRVADWDMLLTKYFGDGRPFELLSVSEHIDTRTANGRIALGIRIQVFQWERETISERTRDKLAWRASQGLLVSRHPPYGYDRVLDASERVKGVPRTSHLVQVPAELATLDLILAMRGQGWGPTRIATSLNARGIAARCGRHWVETTVRKILRRAERPEATGVG
jgi:DNA invertase Pin-like site-specific DNA recombinase